VKRRALHPHLALAAALLAFAVGIAWTVGSAIAWPDQRRRLDAGLADMDALRDLARETGRARAILLTLKDAPDASPPLRDLARRAFQSAEPEFQQRDVLELPDDRRLRRMEVTVRGAPWSEAAAFLEKCAAARPPWTLAEFGIQAEDGSGAARVSLTLEGLAPAEEAR
jgi:hypothetical protein